MTKTPTKLKCRTCETEIEWSDEYPYRPFCSKRCQLIDFGEWANESHKIPGKSNNSQVTNDPLDEFDEF